LLKARKAPEGNEEKTREKGFVCVAKFSPQKSTGCSRTVLFYPVVHSDKITSSGILNNRI